MNASLRQTMLAFWRQRDPDGRMARRAFVALMLALLGLSLWALPGASARIILLACALSTAVFGAWISLMASLLEQNHPNAARLVPGHLRRLRETALLAWLPLSTALGVLLWLSMARIVPLPAMVLAAATACVYVAWAQRNWLLWFLPSVIPAFAMPLKLHVRWAPLWSGIADAWQAQPWSVLALCLLMLGALLARVFGNGDDGHRAGYARRTRMRRAALAGMTGKPAGLSVFGRPGEWLGRPFEAVSAAWLARLVARAEPRPASVMARAEVVLHGPQHWLHHLLGIGVGLAFVGLGFGIAFALVGAHVSLAWQAGGIGLGIGLASAGFNPVFMLPGTLWHTRREQALLTLLPGMPRGSALNRAVARLLLRHFVGAWLLTTLLMLALAELGDRPMLLYLPAAALPVGILTLTRAPAAMPTPGAWTVGLPVLAFLALAAGLWALQGWLDLPTWLAAGLLLAVSAALLAWRWRAVAAAPAALPAGRLG